MEVPAGKSRIRENFRPSDSTASVLSCRSRGRPKKWACTGPRAGCLRGAARCTGLSQKAEVSAGESRLRANFFCQRFQPRPSLLHHHALLPFCSSPPLKEGLQLCKTHKRLLLRRRSPSRSSSLFESTLPVSRKGCLRSCYAFLCFRGNPHSRFRQNRHRCRRRRPVRNR